MDDTQEMYDVLAKEVGSDVEPGPVVRYEDCGITIYPQSGGVLILHRDGTWEGDIAADPD